MTDKPPSDERLLLSTPQGRESLETEKERLTEGRLEHPLREECCGQTRGYIVPVNGQNVVRCWRCSKAQYNAPKVETGQTRATVSSVRSILKPKQRVAVIERQSGACWMCNATDRPLHMAHLLSIDDGVTQGLTMREINHPANVVAMCEECNLRLGAQSVTLRVFHRHMAQLLRAEIARTQQGA